MQIFDPKFKTFPSFFPKQYIFFPRSRLSNRWSIETWGKKNAGTKEQSFFHNVQARLKKIWTTRKKFTCEAIVVALKNNHDFFQDFSSIFQTFSGYGKLPGKFHDFFEIVQTSSQRKKNKQTKAKTKKQWRFSLTVCRHGGFWWSFVRLPHSVNPNNFHRIICWISESVDFRG